MVAGDYFSITYTAAQTELVNITGLYITGDYFKVYDDGNLILTTTPIQPADVDYGDNGLYTTGASAFASGLFSTATFWVPSGDTISIQDLYPPGGVGDLDVEAATPEPASVVLLMLGIPTCVLFRRRC